MRVHYGFALGSATTTELVASSSERVLWRTELPELPPPGPDPTIVGDVIAVRTEAGRGDDARWLVFERKSGQPPCPDPTAPLVGNGKGTDGTLGPVARTRLPAWDLDILHETARTLACAPGTAKSYLLAWYVIEDDRPLRNDNALLLVEDHSTAPPRFTLVQVYRHATNREWNINVSFHSPSEPVRSFDHRPTRDDIDVFLAQSDWHFADDWGRVLAGNVLDEEWRAATHLEPWRAYPKGIEQPD